MAENPKKWREGVYYVDLFAGPGICTIDDNNQRFPGSPIIAAKAPKAFRKLLLCEMDDELASACEARLEKLLPPDRFRVFHGDCNVEIESIAREIVPRALTLAFLDPTGLHLHFSTVQKLSACGAVDLLILFPDRVDVIRNDGMYFEKEDSNLDRVLGPGSGWREKIRSLPNATAEHKCRLYADIYQQQLTRLAGYSHFGFETIRGDKGPLYKLVYATKDSRGLDFWKKSVMKELGGQQRMF